MAWEVEAKLGLLDGRMKVTIEMHVRRLVVESDCQNIAYSSSKKQVHRTHAERITHDCPTLASIFVSVSFNSGEIVIRLLMRWPI